MPQPAFAIFEGGGAKGIAHVGALRVMESYKIQLRGVAGTSAGSLIATLIAAGYRSEEMMHVIERRLVRHLLQEIQCTPIDLLSRRHWPRIERLRNGGIRRTAAWVGASMIALSGVAYTLCGDQPLLVPLAVSIFLFLLPPFLRAWACIVAAAWATYRFVRYRGLISTQIAAGYVNTMVRRKLAARAGPRSAEIPDKVTFKDVESFGACPLRIIATPVGGDRPAVFGGDTTSDVIVAEAVAASIAIPGVFSPTAIPSLQASGTFVDGGIMANLPAWVFAEEKLMDERRNPQAGRVPILAFTLDDAADASARRRRDGLLKYLGDVLRAGIFGSQRPVERFIDDLHVVPIRTSLGTLDFTAGPQPAASAHEDGVRSALAHLGPRFDINASIPAELAAWAQVAQGAIAPALAHARLRAGQGGWAATRVCIVEREGARSFRVAYTIGMQQHADDHLLLDRDNPAAPAVFANRKPLCTTISGNSPQSLFMTKYEKILIWSALESIICIPILDDATIVFHPDLPTTDNSKVIAALCIDSDTDLSGIYNDQQLMLHLATGAAKLAGQLSRFHELREQRV